nr:hypothetical protein [Tanacetum cinerariifolium]
MFVIKIFCERNKVFTKRKKCEKIRAKRDCMMVVNEIVNRILEEVEVSLFGKKQDIDDEGEEDEEGEGGSKVWEFDDLNNRKDSITWQSMVWMEDDANMNTLVEYMILFGADNRPPMLDKDLYDSWKSQMELYMQNTEHERMILESFKHGPLIWPTVEENGVIRTKKYVELSAAEKIQAECDMKSTNIIL